MTETTCSKAKTCARLHRLGTHACSNCSHKPADESAETNSNEETTDNESEEMKQDEYGNEGRHLFHIRLTRTLYQSNYVDITADSEEDALDRAEHCGDDEWETDDEDYDYPTIDQTLS